jgi:thiol-disulfide isomerase/thioredoxin
MKTWLTCLLICVIALPMVCLPAPICTGTVVDDRGNRVANIDVAPFWLAGSRTPSGFRAFGAIRSDAKGGFQIKLDHFPTTLFALDADGRRGAVVVVPETAGDIRFQLQPLWRVRYRFEGTGLTDLSQSRIMLKPVAGPMFSQIAGAIEGALLLPPGRYTLTISSPGGKQTDVSFEVTTHDLTLDPVPLAAGIAQYYGRTPPAWKEVEPVNAASFSAEGLHGKWVLVYFWGYWCAPCVNEGLPKLAHFYELNRENRGRFEIVAVHENGVAGRITVEELREKLGSLEKQKWGKPLPFPVLLDRTGEIIKTWGISAYPTTAIINPDGALMRGDLETLASKLDLQR